MIANQPRPEFVAPAMVWFLISETLKKHTNLLYLKAEVTTEALGSKQAVKATYCQSI